MTRSPKRRPRGRPPHPDLLTPAEWRVLGLLREGLSNAEVAGRLRVSINTVRTQVSSMLAKLGLSDRQALAAFVGVPAASRKARDGHLRFMQQEPSVLDPALATDVWSASYLVELFSGLVGLDRELNLTADLAEELPTPRTNADGTVSYVFVLRANARFHDGRRVTAHDVKWSLERAANPHTHSPVALSYLGDIVGATDYIASRSTSIPGIEVIDDRTVEITIDGPKSYFLAKLTHASAFVVDRYQIERDPRHWMDRPNGTGPFQLAEWQPGVQILLESFAQYHLGPPLLESILIRFAGGRLPQYEAGEIDVAEIGVLDSERVRGPDADLTADYVSQAELGVGYLGFDLSQPPFDDVLVRRALAHAVDRQKIATGLFRGFVRVAEGIVPPGIPGYDLEFQGLAFDPALAARLLAESRYSGSPFLKEMRLAVIGPGYQVHQALWQERLGIEVEIQQIDRRRFLRDSAAGLYPFFAGGWVLDYPDPENILDLNFHSRSPRNASRYANPVVDALLEEARAETDVEVRFQLYRRVEHIVVNEDVVWIPQFIGQQDMVIKPYVRGFERPATTVPFLRFVSIPA